MADGQPRKPLWNATHRHLDRALAVCGLSPCEQTIMVIAREESYGEARLRGLHDPLPFRLNVSRLAREAGAARPAVSAALHRLIETGILSETPEGLVINKQYRGWEGAHALSAAQVAFADAGLRPRRRVSPSGYRECHRSVTGGVSPIGDSSGRAPVTDRLQGVSPIGDSFRPPPNNPPIRETQEDSPPPRAPAHAREADAGEGGAAAAGGRVKGFEAVMDAARETFPEFLAGLPSLAIDIATALRGRLDCYVAALRAARRDVDQGRTIDNLHVWCLQVARRYHREGIPATGPIRVVGAATLVARAESPHERRRREMQEGFARRAARNQETSTHDGQ